MFHVLQREGWDLFQVVLCCIPVCAEAGKCVCLGIRLSSIVDYLEFKLFEVQAPPMRQSESFGDREEAIKGSVIRVDHEGLVNKIREECLEEPQDRNGFLF